MNKFLNKILVVALVMTGLFAGTITGKVTDASSGKELAGANVMVDGTGLGAAADANGMYHITNVPNGTVTITASMIGYKKMSKTVTVSGMVNLTFELSSSALHLNALEVLASRATRTTPVAYSNIEKSDIELRLGSQDIPMILNTTPSVYATLQGGGAGDARVNVRGFNQRNVAIMINGVPVNDMENGWVYWSNWDGVADATSSIQMQRGLSAVNLATPSIGGTMNIITDPSGHDRGGKFKQEVGEGNFTKSTLSYHSGLIGDKWAFSGTVVRKVGDGIIDKTWTDAWAYYLGASYAHSEKHRFELYALGAPQRHGQNRYKQNIAAYDSSYARSLSDYDPGGIDAYTQSSSGQLYNENWNVIDPDYNGQEYFYMYGKNLKIRHNPNYLNEIENYFHKPQVNLNWYWTLDEKTRLSSIFYFSGGSGGGTGTFDDMQWDYSGPSRRANWNATIATNMDTLNRYGNPKEAGQSVGFLRNSINRQWTLGAISKINYDYSNELKFQAGIDWRTAEIEHTREVRDLLGGDYAVNGKYNTASASYSKLYNEFDESADDANVIRGDNINYFNTNTVDWLGFFGQAEYKTDMYSLYGMGGYSMIQYSLVDHFKKAMNYSGSLATDKGELLLLSDWFTSIQYKGGGLYRLNDEVDIFGNFGNVEKVPIFDNAIDDINATVSTNPKNEKFISTEFGLNYRAMNGILSAKINAYFTTWENRTLTRTVNTGAGSSGDSDIIFLTGLNQQHNGFEIEAAYQPMDMVRLDAALSIGNWKFTDDAFGTYKNYETGASEDYKYAVNGLKVGDMPQTIVALSASVFPVDGLTLQGVLNIYSNHYANWEPENREVTYDDGVEIADRDQNWKTPSYMKIDLHGYYNLPVDLGNVKVQAFFHIFNALDETYIQDATDNSNYNAYTGDADPDDPADDGKNHKADDAEVFLGTPRSFNIGLNFDF